MYARVRGIYATAITKILLDNGVQITQPTQPIIERFKITNPTYQPPDVTIKDLDDKNGVVIIGDPDVGRKIINIFTDIIPEIIIKEHKPLLYSIYKGIVEDIKNNQIIVDLGDTKGILQEVETSRTLSIGDEIVVSVRRATFNEPPILTTQILVSGKYMRFIKGSDRISFSEHIRSLSKRKELLTLGFMLRPSGWGVRWRSSANYATSEELLNEAKLLKEKIKEIEDKIQKSKAPSLIEPGEIVVEVIFTNKAKEKLDEIRNKVIPTIKYHHYLKSIGKYSDYVEFTEYLLKKGLPRDELSKAILDYHIERLINPNLKNITILQYYVNNTVLEIRGSLLERINNQTIIIHRRFTPGGYYDGLKVPKEENDYGLTLIKLFYPFVIHFYYNQRNELKGIYLNINTPVELVEINTFKYYDLEVDIIKKPGEQPQIIDEDKFDNLVKQGILPQEYANKVKHLLKILLEQLKEHEVKEPKEFNEIVETEIRNKILE